MARDEVNELISMGYDVGTAIEGYEGFPTIYRIEGYGTSTQIAEDESDEIWASFVNEKLYNAHKMKYENSVNPDKPPYTEREIIVEDLAGQVEVGKIEQKDADKQLSEFDKNKTKVTK